MRVCVLGGKGLLGSIVAALLTAAGHDVVVSSRSAKGPGEITADFTTGEGIEDAVRDADVVVHLISDPRSPKSTDIAGTHRLLGNLDEQHLIYVSIVGVDSHPFPYYRAKLAVEGMIERSGQPNTILRATQFHDFLAFLLRKVCAPPVALVPKNFVFQPIETREVAETLVELVDTRLPGLQPDLAGPAVHRAEYLARTFMEMRGRERPMLNLPLPGKSADAFRRGVHTNPNRAVGRLTWEEFLAKEIEEGRI